MVYQCFVGRWLLALVYDIAYVDSLVSCWLPHKACASGHSVSHMVTEVSLITPAPPGSLRFKKCRFMSTLTCGHTRTQTDISAYIHTCQVVGTTELQREGASALVARSLIAWFAQVFACLCTSTCMYQFMRMGM